MKENKKIKTVIVAKDTELAKEIADAAKAYDWHKVLQLLNEHPELVNSTRPHGKSGYTAMHQAAHGKAPVEVIHHLLMFGASLSQRTAKGERPVDIAKSKGCNDFQIQLLTPVQENTASQFFSPETVIDAQNVCALRFLGYEYENAAGISSSVATGAGLSKLIQPVVESFLLHESDNNNFAAFFGLQRYLGKWGGDHLTKYAEEHLAFDFLFLHLYLKEPQAQFRNLEFCRVWESKHRPISESIAAVVRKSFVRIGHGPKSGYDLL